MAGSETANIAYPEDWAMGLSDQFLPWLRAVGMSFPAVSKLSGQRHFLRLGDSGHDRLGPNGSFSEVLNPMASAPSGYLGSMDRQKLRSHSSERRARPPGVSALLGGRTSKLSRGEGGGEKNVEESGWLRD